MMYADYEFYQSCYFGNQIKAADFPRLAVRASSFLDYYTRGKAEKNSNLKSLKMACCALAEQYQAIDQAQALVKKSLDESLKSSGGELQSQSVGGWSKSYRSGGESAISAAESAKAAQAGLVNVALQYLAGTGLLYRGGCGYVPSHCDGL